METVTCKKYAEENCFVWTVLADSELKTVNCDENLNSAVAYNISKI
jgi:transketolase N-terminal domain/subunit